MLQHNEPTAAMLGEIMVTKQANGADTVTLSTKGAVDLTDHSTGGVGGNSDGEGSIAVGGLTEKSPPEQVVPDIEEGVVAGTEITKPLQVGQKDASGAEITNIYASTRQFLIYEAGLQVKYLLPADFATAKNLRSKIAELGGLRASIEDWRCDISLSANEKMRAARETAWALALAFENDKAEAAGEPKEILTRVDARLRSLVRSHYRKRYCLANLCAFAAIEAILLVLSIALVQFGRDALNQYAVYAMFGGLGAFLSVITGIRWIDIDLNLSPWEHIFAGTTRILIGVVGAIVIGLALDSRFIDPTFGGNADVVSSTSVPESGAIAPRYALKLILSFLAGFSESLAPNLLRRGEQTIANLPKQDLPDAPIVKDMKPA